MTKQFEVYKCAHCGNIVEVVHGGGASLVCCGEKMQELTANTTEAAQEKHLPVIAVNESLVTVTVGETVHPMAEEHSIQWIYLQTKKGGQRKALKPGEAPKAVFALAEDEPVAAYAYCNLHGLWKTEI